MLLAVSAAAQECTPASSDAELPILSPADGAVVINPVTVRFGLSGLGVVPVGVEHPDIGHHHLLIHVFRHPIAFDEPIPATSAGAMSEVVRPGSHLICSSRAHSQMLLLGHQFHVAHDTPMMSCPMSITVVQAD